MLKIRRADPEILDEPSVFPDLMVYHTKAWISFVAETQAAEPVVAEVYDGETVVGHLFGLMIRRYGLRIFGSPFPGWTTMYMGFNLQPGVPRVAVAKLAPDFVFRELRCVHMELVDKHLTGQDAEPLGFGREFVETYETDLTQTEDEIFSSMKSSCRRCIRKAAKSNLQFEEAHDAAFAEEYYDQLKDVFLKQRLVPTYGLDRVQALIKWLHPTGNLLLLRARDTEGRCVATGIYAGMNDRAQFWGNASYRWGQQLRPNEALHWYAMRYWKARGAKVFDWGGGGTYKEKYGCIRVTTPRLISSRNSLLMGLRDGAQRVFAIKQRFLGRLA